MRPWRAFWGLSLAGASVILLGACLKLWQDPTTSTELHLHAAADLNEKASVLSSKAMMPRPLSAAISRLSFSKLNPLPPGMFPRVSVMSHNESIPQGWPTLRTQWKSDLWGPRWNASALPSDLRAAQHARKTLLAEVCARYRRGGAPPVTLASTAHVSRLFVEERHRLLYCEIPKAGCTNWKRLLMVLSGHAPSTTAVLHTAAHYANGLRRLDSYPRREIERRLRTYTKVLFVREPLERLVSAFRDKLQRPNPYYGPLYGRAILARYRNNASRSALHSGTGVTFREFLRFLMDPHRPLAPDVHWEPAARLCHPCYITYDFIGHFEDLASEADAFLAALGIPPTLRFPPKEHDVTEAVRTEAMDLSREKGSFEISRQYFSRLLQRERQLAYDLYYLDYIMFNYSKPFSDVH